jgi:uncharacterized membrane protein YpjA
LERLRRVHPLLVALNLVGAVYGFLWYRGQLASTPFWCWPLVADCPMAALLAALATWRWASDRPAPVLFALAKGSAVYLGAWTLLFFLLAGRADPLLLVSHVALLLEGLVFWRAWPTTTVGRAWLLALLAGNALVDYGLGLHPAMPARLVPAMAGVSGILWLALAAATGVVGPAARTAS